MHKHRIYGTASVNEKGQIVIPAEARKDLALGTDDKLVVIGGHGKALCIVRSDVFEKRMNGIMRWFFKDERVEP
jgi:AbrB family looped-hinge helix DNA binding protein